MGNHSKKKKKKRNTPQNIRIRFKGIVQHFWELHQPATTLKPQTGEVNSINRFGTVQCSLLGNLWVLEEQKADFTLTRTYLITAADQTHTPIAAVSQHNACILKKTLLRNSWRNTTKSPRYWFSLLTKSGMRRLILHTCFCGKLSNHC